MSEPKPAEPTAREVIGQLCGELTMCWQPIPAGVFDSTKAKELVDKIFDYFHLNAGMNITRYRDVMTENARLRAALEVYARTDEEFPWRGTIAREALNGGISGGG